MADGKSIEIKIAATGGEQAAAEITKVSQAAAGLSPVGALPDADNFAGINELHTRLENLAEKTKNLGKAADESSPQLDRLINIQRAQVANTIASGLGSIGAAVRAAAKDFQKSDPEFSSTLENVSSGLDSVSAAAQGAAQGFSVGGPFGAAVGALVGGALPLLKSSFADMTESLSAASSAQLRAEGTTAALAAALGPLGVAAREAMDAEMAYREETDNLTESIDRQTAAIAARNRLQNAKDATAAAKRDEADDEEIRNGAAPEDVRSRRASFDAEQKRKKLVADQETSQVQAQGASEQAALDRVNLANLAANPTTTPATIAAADAASVVSAKRANQKIEEYQAARAEAQEKLQQINSIERREQEAAAAGKSAREKRERDTASAKADAEARKTAAAANQVAKSATRSSEKSAAELGRIGREAEGLVPRGASEAGRRAIEKISDGLQNGDQGGELKSLLDLLEKLASHVEKNSSSNGGGGDGRALSRRIEIMEQRIRNLPK